LKKKPAKIAGNYTTNNKIKQNLACYQHIFINRNIVQNKK